MQLWTHLPPSADWRNAVVPILISASSGCRIIGDGPAQALGRSRKNVSQAFSIEPEDCGHFPFLATYHGIPYFSRPCCSQSHHPHQSLPGGSAACRPVRAESEPKHERERNDRPGPTPPMVCRVDPASRAESRGRAARFGAFSAPRDSRDPPSTPTRIVCRSEHTSLPTPNTTSRRAPRPRRSNFKPTAGSEPRPAQRPEHGEVFRGARDRQGQGPRSRAFVRTGG